MWLLCRRDAEVKKWNNRNSKMQRKETRPFKGNVQQFKKWQKLTNLMASRITFSENYLMKREKLSQWKKKGEHVAAISEYSTPFRISCNPGYPQTVGEARLSVLILLPLPLNAEMTGRSHHSWLTTSYTYYYCSMWFWFPVLRKKRNEQNSFSKTKNKNKTHRLPFLLTVHSREYIKRQNLSKWWPTDCRE